MRSGDNMKKIIAAAGGGKIRVRGRGSNYKEGVANREADVPLQVTVTFFWTFLHFYF
jgi:hypothetical protein